MANTGLVLEGGGMRGVYGAGVLDAFIDLGIKFLDVIGVSAGAANALSYISWQYRRNYTVYTTFAPDDRYVSFKSYLKTGSFFGMQFVFYEVPRSLVPFDYDTYNNSPQKLTAVATDVETGKPFYMQIGNISEEMDCICASSAIPMASRIVHTRGRKLMDGGASDSIPIEYSLGKGNTKNVIVLSRNEGYRAKKGKLSFFPYLFYPKYRAFAHAVANRFDYYNKSIEICEEQERAGDAIIIRPSMKLESSYRFERDPEKLKLLYQNGYEDAMRIRDRLLSFLSGSDNVLVEKP